jgi:NADH-quinone oxidoreductase subunit J
MLDSILFYTFGGVAVLSAALMVTRRNPLHSAVFLITTLLATGGIFLQLRADFLFVAQIILYACGIMVLFLFVIMLVRVDAPVPQMRFRMQKLVALAVVFALGFEVLVILFSADKLPGEGLFVQEIAASGKLPPNSEALARSLFTTYSLPFEMAGVLLLVAIVGAVVMAKSRNGTDES